MNITTCPTCGYKHGFGHIDDEFKQVSDGQGEFYQLAIKMQRGGWDRDENNVLGCPNCGSLFMEGIFPWKRET